MALVVDELKQRYSGQVAFRVLDVDDPEQHQQALALGLNGHPAIALLDRQGQVLWRAHGLISKTLLQKRLDAVISEP